MTINTDEGSTPEPSQSAHEAVQDKHSPDFVARDNSVALSRTIRRQRVVIAVALASAILALAGLTAPRFIKSPSQVSAEARPPSASVITAIVEKRVLSSTVILRGSIGTSAQIELTPSISSATSSGAAIVTAIRVKQGGTVEAGRAIIEISGRPLIALPGPIPAYRDLKPGDSGNDVKQLQSALRSLGYFTQKRDGYFGSSTKSAITRLYASLGYDVPTTGGVGDANDRSALQSAQSAVESAQRAVDDMRRQIVAAASIRVSPSVGSSAVSSEEPLPLQLRYLMKALNQAISDRQYLQSHTGAMMPLAEVAYVPRFPARVTAIGGAVGAPVRSPLVTIATGQLIATDHVDPTQAKFLKVGMAVQIDSELLAVSQEGTIAAIGPVTIDTPSANPNDTGANAPASGTTQASGVPYVPLVVVPAQTLPASWNGQDVRLTVTSARTQSPVLTVPLAAVTTRANGETIVTRVRDNTSLVSITVHAGVSADGYVEITPSEDKLIPGDRVVVGQ